VTGELDGNAGEGCVEGRLMLRFSTLPGEEHALLLVLLLGLMLSLACPGWTIGNFLLLWLRRLIAAQGHEAVPGE
jgi:hypothetical protein